MLSRLTYIKHNRVLVCDKLSMLVVKSPDRLQGQSRQLRNYGAATSRNRHLYMPTFTRMKGIFPIVVMLVLVGCATSRPLMPTPAIYVDQKEGLFEDVPPALRAPEVDILYVTDRRPVNSRSAVRLP